ncbi:MAG: hypothetical protein BGO68_01240 [Candidatus Amoebophilus sp. 36-38]|nr:MAG: hypothetical protein BGO68_01240 [Candidatus Amoebophilus sp. 36-38]
MWLIGIRSGIITLLALIAYKLLVQTLSISNSFLGHLEHIVFGLGIYSAHYYYRYANKGTMSYKQGIQVGMITVLFTSLIASLLTYSMFLKYGKQFMSALFMELKNTAQQLDPGNSLMQDNPIFIELINNPRFFIFMMFLSITLTGFIFTLLISLFSRTRN